MNRRMFPLVLALVSWSVLACGGDDDNDGDGGIVGPTTGLTLANLVGTWTATRFEFRSNADPSLSIDLIAQGVGVNMTVQQSGRFSLGIQANGAQDTFTGSASVQGNQLLIQFDGDPEPVAFNAQLNGNTLTLSSNDETFDFDGDDIDEPASLTVILQRQ